MPTDALARVRETMRELDELGLETLRAAQWELGRRVRTLLAGRGFPSVAAAGFEAPGVIVSYTDDAEIQSGRKFLARGLQAAAGVPLMCDEPAGFRSFRLGLFGIDKLTDIDGTLARLAAALDGL
jgi:aspartate aminotransferase-like enzyme